MYDKQFISMQIVHHYVVRGEQTIKKRGKSSDQTAVVIDELAKKIKERDL